MKEKEKLLGVEEELVKGKQRQKRKPQVPIYIDLDANNEQSKKRRRAKLNMAEAVYEEKKIDTEIQKTE